MRHRFIRSGLLPSPRCLTFFVTCGLLSTSGCLVAPTPMPTSFPRASDHGHLNLGIGFQMTFNSKLESAGKGEEVLSGALGPPDLRVLGLQMLFASYRRHFGEAWDWGVDGALSRVGGSVRWGSGSDRYAISVQAGVHWLPLKSVQGHGEVQLGFRSKHFMAFFTAGLVGSHMTYAVDRSEEQSSPTDFFLSAGPDQPWLEIPPAGAGGPRRAAVRRPHQDQHAVDLHGVPHRGAVRDLLALVYLPRLSDG